MKRYFEILPKTAAMSTINVSGFLFDVGLICCSVGIQDFSLFICFFPSYWSSWVYEAELKYCALVFYSMNMFPVLFHSFTGGSHKCALSLLGYLLMQ